jgi:hypothetical protein
VDIWNKTVRQLRDAGYVVVIWTPEEVGEADAGQLEDIAIERGNEYLAADTEDDHG